MTAYKFYDGSIAGCQIPQEATPGDLNEFKIRRGFVDTTKQNLANADVAQAIKINAGEIVSAIWYRVITAEGTANAKLDLGFNGGTEGATDLAVTPANTIGADMPNFDGPYYFAATNYVTLSPTNGVGVDAGVFEVCAVVSKGFDKM